MNKELLKTILSIPSYTRMEYKVSNFVIEWLKQFPDIKWFKDRLGNLYIEKGKVEINEFYPCLCAHMDTVFLDHVVLIKRNLNKTIIENEEGILTALDPISESRTGIGGDDLCGVFICLELLQKLDNIKIALFVQEEIGCCGSNKADWNFFQNVGYAIQFDTPRFNWISETLMDKRIYTDEFLDEIKPILNEYKIDNYSHDPYTDMWKISSRFKISTLVLGAGYYNQHTYDEYVKIKDVENALEMGEKIIQKLKLNKWIYVKKSINYSKRNSRIR